MAKKISRLSNDTKIIVAKNAENPFEKGSARARLATAVLRSHGKTYAQAKAAGADSWVVRQMIERKLVRLAVMA